MTPQLAVEERRDLVRRRILDAAWTEAEAAGIGGISLRSLAAAVGMKAPSLYVYFDSKTQLYDALFADAARTYLDGFDEAASGPPGGAALAGLTYFLRFAVENPARFQLLFQRPIPGFEPSAESYAVAQETYDRFVALVGKAVEHGHLGRRALEPASLDLMTAVASGLASQQLANEPEATFEEGRWTGLRSLAVEMFEKMFGPEEER